MSTHNGIEYIILQDTLCLAASEKIDTVEAISTSKFLLTALLSDSVFSRTIYISGVEVYEVTKRFLLND